jgi:hypothetical protein
MKRMLRDPFRFEVFDLLVTHAQQNKVTINANAATEQLLDRVRSSVEKALRSDTFIFGQHTQALFEALTISLGAVTLLKREDAGEIFADEDVEMPDYRVILRSGHELLVEVKNHYQKNPFEDALKLTKSYGDGMLRYAELMSCPLRYVVFWARWNVWTLVAPDVFKVRGDSYELTFNDAMVNNDMALLGDKEIGTAVPLKMRFVADPSLSRILEPDGQVTLKFSEVKLFCKDKEITDPLEKSIAWYLMLYGRWGPGEPTRVEIVNGAVEYLEDEFTAIADNEQGFEIVGSLSGMYSAFYHQATAPEGQIGQIRLDAVPGKLAELVPEGYRGQALPIWIFIMSPRHPLPQRGSATTTESKAT